MKLIPASSARWTIRTHSSWSFSPQAPNIMAPRHKGLTCTPVRPSNRWFMYRTVPHRGWHQHHREAHCDVAHTSDLARGRPCTLAIVLLYDSPLSGNCYKVRLLHAHLNRAYERREVDVLDRAGRPELLGALNPALRVPVLTLD